MFDVMLDHVGCYLGSYWMLCRIVLDIMSAVILDAMPDDMSDVT